MLHLTDDLQVGATPLYVSIRKLTEATWSRQLDQVGQARREYPRRDERGIISRTTTPGKATVDCHLDRHTSAHSQSPGCRHCARRTLAVLGRSEPCIRLGRIQHR